MKLPAALCSTFLIIACPFTTNGQAVENAPEPLAVADVPAEVRLNVEVLRKAADDALGAGMPSIARSLYLRILEVSPDASNDESFVQSLASACLAVEQPEEVLTLLDAHPYQKAWWHLDMALALLQSGKTAAAKQELAPPFDPAALDASLAPWYNLAQGLIKSREGDDKGAADDYAKAAQNAPALLATHIEILQIREQLSLATVDENTVTQLRQKMRDLQGQRGGFEAARLLALALSQLDRKMEAMTVLDDQLRYTGVSENGVREQLLLLLGSIAGPETIRGRTALQEILLSHNAPRRLMSNALGMLAGAASADNSVSLHEVLNTVITADAVHPLMDELLLLRSNIGLESGQMDAAAADAQRIIDQFPASSLRHAALRSLAYIAFTRQPPQYRTAANYLTQLRTELPHGAERAMAGILIADCFYVNADYANAATAYADVSDEAVPDKGIIFYQMVRSMIEAGRQEDARNALDSLAPSYGVDPMHRWRAEWNLIHAMRAGGKPEAAFERLAKLLNDKTDTPPPPSLRLRLMWLEAQLSLDAGKPEQTPARCQIILDSMGSVPDEVIDKTQRDIISSQTLLLKAQALLAVSNEATAVSSLELLRLKYPNSVAAQNSYLVQARYLAHHERLVEAQRLLLTLADRYPNSDQAPIALWEAAISAEQRGLEVTYREAISLLNRLVSDYPGSDLVYYAKLKQGDILRKLNDFGTALLAYEDIINHFAKQPDLYLAQMSRGDCIIAQSSTNPVRRADGIAIYERLMERQDVPVDFRAEASFKWAYNLDKLGDSTRAIDAYWMSINRYLDASSGPQMGARGRYWVSRCAVELGQLLEVNNRYEEARRVYNIMLEANIPGKALAQARLKRLDEPKIQP